MLNGRVGVNWQWEKRENGEVAEVGGKGFGGKVVAEGLVGWDVERKLRYFAVWRKGDKGRGGLWLIVGSGEMGSLNEMEVKESWELELFRNMDDERPFKVYSYIKNHLLYIVAKTKKDHITYFKINIENPKQEFLLTKKTIFCKDVCFDFAPQTSTSFYNQKPIPNPQGVFAANSTHLLVLNSLKNGEYTFIPVDLKYKSVLKFDNQPRQKPLNAFCLSIGPTLYGLSIHPSPVYYQFYGIINNRLCIICQGNKHIGGKEIRVGRDGRLFCLSGGFRSGGEEEKMVMAIGVVELYRVVIKHNCK